MSENTDRMNQKLLEMAASWRESPEVVEELVAFGSRFYRYSVRNTMLIYSQNPHATYVQSYLAWKRLGYHVRRGEQGIKVLTPVETTFLKTREGLVSLRQATAQQKEQYKNGELESVTRKSFVTGNVFDISQTDVPKEKYPEFYYMGIASVFHADVIQGLAAYAKEILGCQVVTEDLQSISLRGDYRPGRIRLNALLEDTERLSTFAHELGHAVMDHAGSGLSAAQKEFEADAFGIMLSSFVGAQITDGRRRHFASQYQALLEADPQMNLLELLVHVQKVYRGQIEPIKTYVGRQVNLEHLHLQGILEAEMEAKSMAAGGPSQKQMDFVQDIARTLGLKLPEKMGQKEIGAFIGKYKKEFFDMKSAEELADIKDKIRIVDYARSYLHLTVRKVGAYYGLDEFESMRIDDRKNCFFRNSLQGKINTGSIIDFAAEYGHGGDVKAAIQELKAIYRGTGMEIPVRQPYQRREIEANPSKTGALVLPEHSPNMHRVYAYLTKTRYIDQDIVQEFVDRKMLYQDKRGNCVFVSYDREGKPDFGFLRGTHSDIKYYRELEHGDYSRGFYIDNQAPRLIVTESAIDAASIMTILKGQGRDHKEYDYQILAGVGKYACVANNLIASPKREVLFALDNDEAGVRGIRAILDDMREKGVKCPVSLHLPSDKDWNKDLVNVAKKFQSLEKIPFLGQKDSGETEPGQEQKLEGAFTICDNTLMIYAADGGQVGETILYQGEGSYYYYTGMVYDGSVEEHVLTPARTAACDLYRYQMYSQDAACICQEETPRSRETMQKAMKTGAAMTQMRLKEIEKNKGLKELQAGLELEM